MFIIQYWITILWCHAQKRWGKVLKEKNLREQEEGLRRTVEKLLQRRKENEALKGDLSHDPHGFILVVGEEIDWLSQASLSPGNPILVESEGGH